MKKSVEKVDETFTYYVNEVGYILDELERKIQELEITVGRRGEMSPDKFFWLKDEERLITLFNKLLQEEFIELSDDLVNSLTYHFRIGERKKIPVSIDHPSAYFN
jgi:hypothetical protein